jgi:hypothetical protein
MNEQIKRGLKAASVVGAGALALAGQAQAALPASVTTAMTSIQTDGLALIDLAWPVVAALVGGFVLIKLFKRAASKV